jgi:hypothetical protein
MAGKGGYQMPNNPAQVSLPGSGQRTDGNAASKQAIERITGLPYGENQDFINIEKSADMSKAAPLKGMPTPQIRKAVEQGAQPQDNTVLADVPQDQQASPVPQSATETIDPQEALARALYAMNPTENLRRVVSQFDKNLG